MKPFVNKSNILRQKFCALKIYFKKRVSTHMKHLDNNNFKIIFIIMCQLSINTQYNKKTVMVVGLCSVSINKLFSMRQ